MTDYIASLVAVLVVASLSIYAAASDLYREHPSESAAYTDFAPPVEMAIDPAVVPAQTIVSAEPQEPPTEPEEKIEDLTETVGELQRDQNVLNLRVKKLTKDIREGNVGDGKANR